MLGPFPKPLLAPVALVRFRVDRMHANLGLEAVHRRSAERAASGAAQVVQVLVREGLHPARVRRNESKNKSHKAHISLSDCPPVARKPYDPML